MAIAWVVLSWLAIGLGVLCSLAVIAVAILAVAALVMGSECEDEEDENRVKECERMAMRLHDN